MLPSTSMPGDPTGIPATASPLAFGFSSRNRRKRQCPNVTLDHVARKLRRCDMPQDRKGTPRRAFTRFTSGTSRTSTAKPAWRRWSTHPPQQPQFGSLVTVIVGSAASALRAPANIASAHSPCNACRRAIIAASAVPCRACSCCIPPIPAAHHRHPAAARAHAGLLRLLSGLVRHRIVLGSFTMPPHIMPMPPCSWSRGLGLLTRRTAHLSAGGLH